MGQFDNVKFRHVMPDGYAGDGEDYQTKDLRFDMDMAYYEVDSSGRLIRTASDIGQPLGDVRFHYTLTIDAPAHTYALAFADGLLRTIHCFQTDRTVPFHAAT
ncbi:conserved protein of unknown function (plasmid) [Cupriavidus taiwanensis]|uniref:Uncharacterized protein n=1 Tax=Cupriavidus taiwanensis TaxID=164546 RepID=A0A375IU97_9BURK|nr:hypothetical protein [Cupriavidus taiwanensis]SPK77199.1 conserved protein of unknown function [Cupriavidus taiwanensis]